MGCLAIEDPFSKYVDDQAGETRPIRLLSFDKNGKNFRTFTTPRGFSIEKYFADRVDFLECKIVALEPVLFVNCYSKKSEDVIFTFVRFYQ